MCLEAGLEPAPVVFAGRLSIAGAGFGAGLSRPSLALPRVFVADPYWPPGRRCIRQRARSRAGAPTVISTTSPYR